MTISDQEELWVLRAQCDDRDALEMLLGSVQRSLHRYLCGLVGASDAPDIMQDVLLLIYRKLDRLESPELFRPWLFRIASRAAVRHLKRRKRWTEETLDENATLTGAGEAVPALVVEDMLATAAVSPASRAVLILHFQEELPLTTVAAILEIPVGTVKSRLAYGLAALRKEFGKERSR